MILIVLIYKVYLQNLIIVVASSQMKILFVVLFFVSFVAHAQNSIQSSVSQAGKMYFGYLQLKEINHLLSKEKQNEFELKFNQVQSPAEFEQEFLKLRLEIEKSPLTQINKQKVKELKKNFLQQIYFAWGYNRNYHSNTDVKFMTPDGTFIVHDAVGKDRPSPFSPEVYFLPKNISIPQYNMELGVMVNEKWGIELKQDHMKLVFDQTRPYEISGNYDRKVVVTNPHPTNEWDQQIPVDFEIAKKNKDASWLLFEHSDGYNYVSIGSVYNQNLYQTRNQKFSIDARFGAGGGIMVPKTKVMMHQDARWNWHGLDNRFHIAGGGVHAEAKLRLTFWEKVFIQAATRGTYIKVKDALVDGSESRMEHVQPISSVQFMGQVGYTHKFKSKK
jgi:hypothetical protein